MNLAHFSVEDIHTKKINYKSGHVVTSRYIDVEIETFKYHFSAKKRKYKVFNDKWLVRKIKMDK